MFVCRFCNATFEKFISLKLHVIQKHYKYETKCPVCHEEYKDLKVHAYNKAKHGDKEHAVYFGLISRSCRSRVGKNSREYAYALCEVVR